jgi:Mg2+ and Co2+ transporter CorA
MFEEGHLLLILHEVPVPDAVERKPAFFWRSPAGEWKAYRMVMPSGTLFDFLKVYEDRLLKLEAQENQATGAAAHHAVLENVAPVLRAVRGVHRSLQQARDMVKDDRELINHRDRAAALERTAELLLQDAQFGLSFIAARQSESQAESAARMATTAHRLNIIAALFLPLTAVASVLGMDIASGLSNTRENFWLIVAGSVSIGLVIALMVRRKG